MHKKLVVLGEGSDVSEMLARVAVRQAGRVGGIVTEELRGNDVLHGYASWQVHNGHRITLMHTAMVQQHPMGISAQAMNDSALAVTWAIAERPFIIIDGAMDAMLAAPCMQKVVLAAMQSERVVLLALDPRRHRLIKEFEQREDTRVVRWHPDLESQLDVWLERRF